MGVGYGVVMLGPIRNICSSEYKPRKFNVDEAENNKMKLRNFISVGCGCLNLQNCPGHSGELKLHVVLLTRRRANIHPKQRKND